MSRCSLLGWQNLTSYLVRVSPAGRCLTSATRTNGAATLVWSRLKLSTFILCAMNPSSRIDTNPTRATSQLWLKPGGSNKSVAVSVNLYPFTSRNPDGLTAYDLVSSMRA